MDKMIVITFDNEPAAYAASRALKELHWQGSLTLYSGSVVIKDQNGRAVVKQTISLGERPPVLNLATSLLIGAISNGSGAFFGQYLPDLITVGVGEEFLRDVARSLNTRRAAVVAEIEEHWITPL